MKFLKLIFAFTVFMLLGCTEGNTSIDKGIGKKNQSVTKTKVKNILSMNKLENNIFTNDENGFETFLSFKEGFSEQNGTMTMSQSGCQYVFNVSISGLEIDAEFFKSTCGNESSDTRLYYDKEDNSLSMKINGQRFIFYSEFSDSRKNAVSEKHENEEEIPEYDEAQYNRQQEEAERQSSIAYYSSNTILEKVMTFVECGCGAHDCWIIFKDEQGNVHEFIQSEIADYDFGCPRNIRYLNRKFGIKYELGNQGHETFISISLL